MTPPKPKFRRNRELSFPQYVMFFLFGWLARIFISLLFMTCRTTVFGREIEKEWESKNPGKKLLYASWHRGLFYFVYFYRFLNFVVMASKSKDGELAAQATHRFGWIPIRGSSSKGGRAALPIMEELFLQGFPGGLVVDAPRGPLYKSKMGIIVLAKRTGLPIIPVMWSAEKCWRLKNWDRTIIPKPFSRIVFIYNREVFEVPPDSTNEECEERRAALDKVLLKLTYQADNYFISPRYDDPRDIPVPDTLPPGQNV